MENKKKKHKKHLVLPAQEFDVFLNALHEAAYEIIAPTVQDQAVVLDQIDKSADLPIGWTDAQREGSYHIFKNGERSFFNFNVGPHAWKKYLHLAELLLFTAKTNSSGFKTFEPIENVPKRAFLGVRPCEVAAIQKQDKIFLQGNYVDTAYKLRRDNALIIAVNCGRVSGNCFCASMETGPQARSGFDLCLTEIRQDERHVFILEIGNERGKNVLAGMPALEEATEQDIALMFGLQEEARKKMGKDVDTTDIQALFYDNYEHSVWNEIATRCMNCGNCTLVCPTCFCTNIDDVTDLTGAEAERWRRWDSCFTMDFSYIHGGSIRPSAENRYRHWITHKFAAWHDQFDESGCVGCGRCITWCPVGIDVTQEIRKLQKTNSPVEIQRVVNHGNTAKIFSGTSILK